MQTGGGPNPRTAQGVARLGTVGPGGTGGGQKAGTDRGRGPTSDRTNTENLFSATMSNN